MNNPTRNNPMFVSDVKPARRLRPWSKKIVSTALAAAALLTSANFSSAAQLTWDAGITNNVGTTDAASGSWNFTYPVTNFTATTSTTSTSNVNLVAGGLEWFQVDVPANALAATNSLLYATNLPVNVWFSLTQTTNNVGDTLLAAGITSGVIVLTTNLASAPTNIVPGTTYYIGVDNSANLDPVGYALQVDLSRTNEVVTTSPLLNWNTGSGNVAWTQTGTTAPLNGAIFAGTDAGAGTYQVALTGVQMAFTNLQVNANGYAFSGANLYQGPANAVLSVADGKNVTFNNLITGPNGVLTWRLGAGGAAASMTLLGNFTAGQFGVGSTNGSTLWLGGPGTSSGGVFTINANVNHTNGTWANTATWQVGRPGAGGTYALAGTAGFPGVYTMDGDSAILNLSAQMMISRGGGGGKVVIKKGTVNLTAASANATVEVLKESGAEGRGTFVMEGGTMTVGSSSASGVIGLAKGGAGTNSQAVFSQSGGTIRAWGGVTIGAASGTFNVSSLSAFTNSGGSLYVGNVGGIGITRFALAPATNYFVLSGGTIGALQNWSSTMPMTLDTLNGNITFQCADEGSTPFNIALSGALTGPGGLFKTGGGTLTLSGANNYAGSTVVSDGTLAITTAAAPTNGSVTLDGSAGTPGVTVTSNPGQSWSIGTLTFASGSPNAGFTFGALQPSPSVAPIQVAGNVAFTASPAVTITGTAIPVGTYPLIKYTGTVSGTIPTAPTLPGYISAGYITNIVATKTVALVVTSSTYNPALSWRVGNGVWDINTTSNWTQFGNPAKYTEGSAVIFDDSASGSSPITVTLNTTVNPFSMTANNTVSKDYAITGSGSIAGSSELAVLGGGSLTLAGTNTFIGGTTVSSGQLNINFGGSSAADSAIGTGPLTLGLNVRVDNTSGQSVTLQPTIAQSWLDDWTYVGSTNLNTGAGAVTLGSSVVVLTVSGSQLEVGGAISDGGNNYKLQKAGSGTLTLGTDNSFTGGMQLDSGLVQLKTANGLGNGSLTFGVSSSIDNLSGADMAVTGISSITLSGNATITYVGVSNSLDFGAVTATLSGGAPLTVNVVNNTLTFGGAKTTGNSIITKIGQGSLRLAGSGVSQFVGTVNEGELVLAHDFGSAIGTGDSGNGVLVQSNAVLKLAGTLLNQIPDNVDTRLNAGGIFDMNGNTETIGLLRMTNGVLRNGLAGTAATLTIVNGGGAILRDTNNVFDVPDAAASLSVAGNVTGTGSLVKSGAGAVTVQGTNTYTGNTTVSNGNLTINHPFLAATSTVTVNMSGVLTLNFAGSETNTVAALVLNGVSKPAGVYNATTDATYLAGAGSLQVVPPVAINPLAGTILMSVSGSTLSLSWPTNQGWILQNQTNTLNVGLVVNSNAWFNIPGSELVTSTNITINPANGTVFYRMIHP